MTGSPRRLTASCSAPARPSSASPSTLPVSSSAHVEAFTSGELECPRCAPQSDAPILSSISASMVSVSGTRSRASARHMSATPSRVESPYSARKPCMMEAPARVRVMRTRSTVRAAIEARSERVSPAASTHARTARDSSSRIAARIVARISERRGRRWAMPGPRVYDHLRLVSLTRVPPRSGVDSRFLGQLARKFHRFAKRGRGDGQASACCASLGCFRKANASQGAQAYLTVRSELAKQAALEAPWPRSTQRKQSDPRPQP